MRQLQPFEINQVSGGFVGIIFSAIRGAYNKKYIPTIALSTFIDTSLFYYSARKRDISMETNTANLGAAFVSAFLLIHLPMPLATFLPMK